MDGGRTFDEPVLPPPELDFVAEAVRVRRARVKDLWERRVIRRRSCPVCGYPTRFRRGAGDLCQLCHWKDDFAADGRPIDWLDDNDAGVAADLAVLDRVSVANFWVTPLDAMRFINAYGFAANKHRWSDSAYAKPEVMEARDALRAAYDRVLAEEMPDDTELDHIELAFANLLYGESGTGDHMGPVVEASGARRRKCQALRDRGFSVRFSCPVCGYPTLDTRGGYEICRLCHWEDTGIDWYVGNDGGVPASVASVCAPSSANYGFTIHLAILCVDRWGIAADPRSDRTAPEHSKRAVNERRAELRAAYDLRLRDGGAVPDAEVSALEAELRTTITVATGLAEFEQLPWPLPHLANLGLRDGKSAAEIAGWISAPHDALDGATPLAAVEAGDDDKVLAAWHGYEYFDIDALLADPDDNAADG